MSIGVGRKTRLLLGVLLLAALATGLLVIAESPATAQATNTLSLTKSDSPDPVNVGQDLTYTLTVNNNGNGNANNVSITDPLPANTTFVSASAGCTNSGGTVTCNVGTLAGGASATRQIVVRPTAAAAGTTINNTASATASNRPTVTATATTAVRPEANLSIAKTDSPDPVLVGQDLTYTLTITNGGPNTATNVVVTDNLPANTTFVSASAGCTNSGGTVTCNVGTLASGASTTRQIVVRPTAAGTINNTASVTSDTRDPNTSNNNASAATTVVPAADLSLTKTDSPDPAVVGELLTYTLTVTNNGPSAATGVVVRDTLPANATFISASAGCTESGGIVTCDVGDLANGASETREIVVRPTAPGTLNNEAAATSDTADPNDANDTATATTQVNAAELSISKSDSPDPVTYGNDLTYEISVTNGGTANATNVQVTDQLPDDVTFVSAAGGCTYTAGNNTVTCDLGTINAGQTVTRQIVVRPTADAIGTTLTNTAEVTSPNDPTDSTAVATTQVVAANLSITKTDSEDPVLAGENFTYMLEVTNAGVGAATNVEVTDTLPAEAQFVSAPGCDYDSLSHTVTCDLGTINAGDQPVERQITVTAPNDPTTLENTAEVTSPNDHTDSGDAEQTTVVAAADLAIDKQAPAEATDEQEFDYTLTVTNGGPNAAQGVVVEDNLPDGVTYNDGASTASCELIANTPDPNDVRCTLADPLPANGQATFTINVTPTQPGEQVNQATVDSDTADPNAQNNSDVARTVVLASSDLTVAKSAPATVTDGQRFTYTLDVANGGPSDATGVVVTDELPIGVEFVRADTDERCEYDEDTRTVTCELGDLASGDATQVQIGVLATQPGTTENTASVTGNEPDPDTTNNADTATTQVNAAPNSADLAIDKQAPAEATDEQEFDYTLTVTNNGPDAAAGVLVEDELPDGVELVSVSPECSYHPNDNTVICEQASLASTAGQNTAVFTIRVKAKQPGDQVNRAVVSSDTPDHNEANNTDAATTTVNAAADLSIDKSDSPDQVDVGQELTYTLTVTNNGPSDATGVKVSDDLPNSVTYYGASSSPECSLVNPTENIVECGPVSLADSGGGATRAFTIKVTPQPGAAPSITNTASVSGNEFDPDGGNNEASENTTVNPVADLAINKEAPAEVADEEEFVYTLTVTNDGPSAAEGTVVTDQLPDGVEFVSSADCQNNAGTVTCNLGTLTSGETVVVEIRVLAKTPGGKDNAATVESSTDDPNDQNNSDTALTVVWSQPGHSADLSIEKSANPEPVTVGSKLTYTLTVENGGPDTATGVVVRDHLPRGVTLVSASGDCRNSRGTVICNVGSMADGASVTRKIVVRVRKARDLRNTATVTGTVNDPRSANDLDTEHTTVKNGDKGGRHKGGGRKGGGHKGDDKHSCSDAGKHGGKAKAGHAKAKGSKGGGKAKTKHAKAHGSCHGGRAHVG